MIPQFYLWLGFGIFVVAMLALDLGLLARRKTEMAFKEAALWSIAWVSMALLFALGIFFFGGGSQPALVFLTGYVIEQSLSIDNLFVFLLIFSYFKVPPAYQRGVLFWGILGAIIMRAVFILAGVALLTKFHWIVYVFGVMLIVSGIKLALEKDKEIHPEKNIVLRIFRKLMPVTPTFEGTKFFITKDKRKWATPLFVVLIVVETTDLIFAVDSIPAILAISQDPFIVYTSNVFAILGLRSLYFVLAKMMGLFCYLHYGLALILVFVGIKMTISHFIHIPIGLSLFFILAVLTLSILASIIKSNTAKTRESAS